MWYNEGTVSVTLNSTNVVGSGTSWAATAIEGDILLVDNILYEIEVVVSNTQLTLVSNYLGGSGSGKEYNIIFNTVTNSNLAARITGVVDKWLLREDEITAWQGGEINGGVGNDGMYPLTDPDEVVHMVLCPAAVTALAGGGAQQWATNPEDDLVDAQFGGNEVDDYSALHHAAKSATSAGQSSTSAGQSSTSAGESLSHKNAAGDFAEASGVSAGESSDSAGESLSHKNASGVSAGESSDSAAAALVSENAAAASYDSFDDRYLGEKSSDPSVDNDGGALLTGALYWNTPNTKMMVYNGSVWGAAYINYQWTVVSASLTAISFHGYLVNSASVAITVTLPSAPNLGDMIMVKDSSGDASTHNITIDRNGKNIEGSAANQVLTLDNDYIELVYDGAGNWSVVQKLYNYAIYA